MSQSDFDKRLIGLLRHTADAIPSSSDLTQSVHQRIHRGRDAKIIRYATHFPNIVTLGVNVLVVVVLITGILVYTHDRHLPSHIESSPLPSATCYGTVMTPCGGKSGIVGQVAPVKDQGITLQVLRAYADPVGTAVQVAISGAPHLVEPVLDDPSIIFTDKSGKSQPFTASTTSVGSYYENVFSPNVMETFVYLPLSTQQLHMQFQVTFVVHQITLIEKPSSFSTPLPLFLEPQLVGTWKISFILNPVAGKMYTFHAPAVVNQGIGIQMQSLEIAPPLQLPAGQAGGVRILLNISGLPADTLMMSFYEWHPTTMYVRPNCSIGSPCPSSSISVSDVLTLPGFVALTDGNAISYPASLQSSTQMVGASGSIQVELLYRGQGTPNGTSGTLVIANFQILVSENSQIKSKSTLPPFTLEIPLS